MQLYSRRLTVWLTCRRLNKTRLRKTTFSTKWPPHPRAEGGQVEPVLGAPTGNQAQNLKEDSSPE
jgi:hypothetical protein